MFSKLLYAKPIPNKDAVTVSEVLMDLFTQFGTCDTLICDHGSEFTAKVTAELCKMLHIQQQFTPSFVHHCLGACERQHRTLATRLTPFMNDKCNNWDQMVNSVVFSMNNSVNASMGYSPFEIVYGQRPKFPLSADKYSLNLKSVPKDLHSYLKQKEQTLNFVRNDVRDHLVKSKEDMLTRANDKVEMLQVTKGDYVYLEDQPAGAAKKLRNYYSGPYVVETVSSPHTVMLFDPNGVKTFSEPIHIDRIKHASVRISEPLNFFKVVTRMPDIVTISKSCQTEVVNQHNEPVLTETPSHNSDKVIESSNHEPVITETPENSIKSVDNQNEPVLTETPIKSTVNANGQQDAGSFVRNRPKRQIRKPVHLQDYVINEHKDSYSYLSSDKENRKVKRVLAQKDTISGVQYLIQYVGEPAQNAKWVLGSNLPVKVKKAIKRRPPPFI